jgi:hypothetical protein
MCVSSPHVGAVNIIMMHPLRGRTLYRFNNIRKEVATCARHRHLAGTGFTQPAIPRISCSAQKCFSLYSKLSDMTQYPEAN